MNKRNILIVAMLAMILMGSVVLSAADYITGTVTTPNCPEEDAYITARFWSIPPQGHGFWIYGFSDHTDSDGKYSLTFDPMPTAGTTIQVTCDIDDPHTGPKTKEIISTGTSMVCDFFIRLESAQ